MDRFEKEQNKVVHTIVKYDYSIEGQQKHIFSVIKRVKDANCDNLFNGLENRVHAVVTFLALLELLNLQMIKVVQGEGFNTMTINLC